MRILIVHDEREHLGGAETVLRELTAALRLHGCTVEWAHDRVAERVRWFEPDFVCCMTLIVKVGLGVLEWLQYKAIPHCILLADYWPGCAQRNRVNLETQTVCLGECMPCPTGRAHPHVTEVVNRSPVVAWAPDQVDNLRLLGVRADIAIPCGLDPDFWTPSPDRPAEPVRVVASTAWSQARYGNIWWKGEQYIGRLQSDLGITIRSFTGIPRATLRDVLQQSHIYVFPSVWDETWGYCLMEGMACGLACVAFDQAGARAQIDDGVDGLIVPRGDYDALRNAVAGLLADRGLRERLGRAAVAKVRSEFTLQRMGAEYVQFFRHVMARNGPIGERTA